MDESCEKRMISWHIPPDTTATAKKSFDTVIYMEIEMTLFVVGRIWTTISETYHGSEARDRGL